MLSRGDMRAVHMTAVIRVYDHAGNVIEMHVIERHEHAGTGNDRLYFAKSGR
jgi:hypothetical protein